MIWHYMHHLIFDPLSAWERFKMECLGGALSLAVIFAIHAIAWLLKLKDRP